MKKIPWILLLALCLAFNTTAAQDKNDTMGVGENKTWKAEDWGFEIALPADWQVTRHDKGTTAMEFSNKEKSISGYIAIDKYDGRCDDFINSFIESMIKQYKIKILEKPEGESDATIIYTSVVDGEKSKHYWRVIDSEGEKIRVGFACKKEDYDNYADTFEQRAATLKIIPKGRKAKPAEAEGKTWTSEEWGFELTLPADWKMEISDKLSGIQAALFSSPDGKAEGIVTVQDWQDGCESYFNELISGLKKTYDTEVIKKPLGKSDATIVYTVVIKDRYKRQYYQRAIDAGGTILRVDFDSTKTDFNAYRDTFEQCAATLKSIPKGRKAKPIGTEEKTWTSKKWGFQVSLPADWKMDILDKYEKDKTIVANFENKDRDIYGFICVEEIEGNCGEIIVKFIEGLSESSGIELVESTKGKDDATAVIKNDTEKAFIRIFDVSGIKYRFFVSTYKEMYQKHAADFEKYAASLSPLAGAPGQKPRDKTCTSEKWGFEITLPGDWAFTVLDKIEGTTVARISDDSNGINGIITSEKFEGRTDDYLKAILKTLQEKYDDIESVQTPKGRQKATLVYTSVVGGIDYKYYSYAIDVNGTKFRTVFYCEDKNYAKYIDTLEEYSATLSGLDEYDKGFKRQ
jgi:hypothetical protein